mgnify:FL=1
MISSYLPDPKNNLPALISENKSESDFSSEREILYKILFDMKRDLNELKKLTNNLKKTKSNESEKLDDIQSLIPKKFKEIDDSNNQNNVLFDDNYENKNDKYSFAEEIIEEETLSIQDKELELIIKALERNNGRRKAAANELGISERTLYRKIKQYDLEL